MDVAVRGLLSQPVRDAVDRYLDARMEGRDDKAHLLGTVERARERFAHLIGADPDEVSITKNTSEGLNIVAAGLPWEPGDNLVFCPELEHPNNVYPWLNLPRRLGVELRTVAPHDGRIPLESLSAAIDDRTRLVTVPTVSFSPGFVTDIHPIAEICRRRGVFLLADAAQSIGVLHTDVRRLGVDALATATQKALLGFYGMGFFYCRREWAERLTPVYLARFSVDLGADAHETAMDPERLHLRPGARRFDLGNYNYLAATAVDVSIAMLTDLGTPAIEDHARGLARRLAQGLLHVGLPVSGGDPGADLGHIVAVGKSGGGRHYTAEDPAMNDLYGYLVDRGVRLSIRRGVLRFSLHLYNDMTDVDRVVALAEEWMSTRSD
jgi:cysteine desulfurase/selenocysteine lyase